jgi:hypothetical protein
MKVLEPPAENVSVNYKQGRIFPLSHYERRRLRF